MPTMTCCNLALNLPMINPDLGQAGGDFMGLISLGSPMMAFTASAVIPFWRADSGSPGAFIVELAGRTVTGDRGRCRRAGATRQERD